MVDVRAFPSDVALMLGLLATSVVLNVVSIVQWQAYDSTGELLVTVAETLMIAYVAVFAYWAYGQRRRLRRSVPLEDTAFTEAATVVARLVAAAELAKPPVVLFGPRLGKRAFVTGGYGTVTLVLGPELLGLCTASDEGRAVFQAVVRHELAHLRAGDLRWYQVGMLLRLGVVPIGLLLFFQVWEGLNLLASPIGAAAIVLSAVAQLAITELVARAFLRTREHQADLDAARDDTEGLLAAIGNTPVLRSWLRRHPGGAVRSAAVADPGRLLASAPVVLLLGAITAGSAMFLFHGFLLHRLLSGWTWPSWWTVSVAGAVIGAPLALFAAFGIWRATWHAAGRRPRMAVHAGVLSAGVVLGSHLALSQVLTDFYYNGIPLVASVLAAVFLGSWLLCRWLAEIGLAWYRVDPVARRMKAFLFYAVPSVCLVGGWTFAVLWSWATRMRDVVLACELFGQRTLSWCLASAPQTDVARSVGENMAFGVVPVVVLVVVAATWLGPRLASPRLVAMAAAIVLIAAGGLFGVRLLTTVSTRSALEIRAVYQSRPAQDNSEPSFDIASNPELARFDCATTAPAPTGANPNHGSPACSADRTEKYWLHPVSLAGAEVAGATVLPDAVIEVRLTEEGAARWDALTAAVAGERIAILVDGVVHSAPAGREPLRDRALRIPVPSMTSAEANALAARIAGR